MASRFENYVNERVAEIASAKRAKLQAALDAEIAKIEKQRDRYMKMVEDGVRALVSKVVARAERDGCVVDETDDTENNLSDYARSRIRSMVGLQTKYDFRSGEYLWPEGTPARKAQDALVAFDELCRREARRIVVCKMDLGMKPEAFEKMLAETAAKIDKE